MKSIHMGPRTPHFRRALVFACAWAIIALVGCGSAQKPTWALALKPNATRFKVQVFELPGQTRAIRLDWSNTFAAAFSKRVGHPALVDDEEIRRATLAEGKLVPSFNYAVTTRFLELGEAKILTFTIQNLETGAVLASTRIRGDSNSALFGQLENAAVALLESE